MSSKNLKSLPPSVNKIADEISALLGSKNISPALVVEEAKRLQKKWPSLKTQLKLRDFNYLPSPRRPVINGTGVILHTNLGRAPLGAGVFERLKNTLSGYTNLEVNLHTAKRGGRTEYVDALFSSMVSHYKPVWVNNNAAAILLCLNTFKKEMPEAKLIISRGELVEIGGGFRVPEIMTEGGFELVEIGTTNKTRLIDYEKALRKGPAVVCSINPSNFVMQGFTEKVAPLDLIALCSKYRAPLIYDAGSLDAQELRKLPKGFDAITLSTDKTLGSVQGGLIAAKPNFQKKLLLNPLYRAFRLDKIHLTALEYAFESHSEKTDRENLPVSQMLHLKMAILEERARSLSSLKLSHFNLKSVHCESTMGGGSLPGQTFPSMGLALIAIHNLPQGLERMRKILRTGSPAVLISIVDGQAVINLKTVMDSQTACLKSALLKLDSAWEQELKRNLK